MRDDLRILLHQILPAEPGYGPHYVMVACEGGRFIITYRYGWHMHTEITTRRFFWRSSETGRVSA